MRRAPAKLRRGHSPGRLRGAFSAPSPRAHWSATAGTPPRVDLAQLRFYLFCN
uniref:Uncharacterized protein n=1 Tax=Arundo donax TaxID=35708 RepID=A0A0A8Z643_ARUDO